MATTASATMTRTNVIPTGGQILGSLVRAFGLRLELTGAVDKARQRYFAGKNIEDDNRTALFRAIGTAAASTLVEEQLRSAIASSIEAALELNTRAWNELALLLEWDAERDVFALVAPLFLCLGAIDLGVRLGALARLADFMPKPTEDDFAWTHEEHAGVLLERWRQAANLTFADFVNTVGSEPNTVRAWFNNGSEFEPDSLVAVANMFASRQQRSATEVAAFLRRHHALVRLAKPLRDVAGDLLVDIVWKCFEIATQTYDLLGHSKLPLTERVKAERMIALQGLSYPPSHHLVGAIQRQPQQEPFWAAAFEASTTNWVTWLRLGLTHAKTLRTGIRIGHLRPMDDRAVRAAIMGLLTDHGAPDPDDQDAVVGAACVRGEQLFASGKFEEATQEFRLAAQHHPMNPHVRYRLGCSLWPPAVESLVSYETAQRLFSESEQELWLAHRLALEDCAKWNLPEAWDLPLVEIGWILLESGDLDRALSHGKDIKVRLKRHSVLSAYFVGQVHQARSEWKLAIASYDEALRRDPRFFLAQEAREECRHEMRRKPA